MKNQNQSFENFNELVFEHRNKAYGAYVIRKSYNENVSKSLLLSIAFFSLIVLIGVALSNKNLPKIKLVPIQKLDSIFSTTVEITPPEKLKHIEPTKVKEIIKPKTDITSVEVSDKKVETSVKTNETLTIKKDGDVKGKDSVPVTVDPPVITSTAGSGSNEPLKWVPEMPSFNGDLFNYLTSKLRYPTLAVEMRTQGTVYLTFVVEKDGDIGDIQIMRGVPDGCTEEAIRVVKSMPKWKPGKNNGQPVRVQYNLPVKFRLQ